MQLTLAQIEKDGDIVYLISHIPPTFCLYQYGHRYRAIMERYQHIIRFSVYGHTHSESVFLTSAIGTTEPVGLNLISASATPETSKNPAFTVIDFDAQYLVPVNIYTYYFDLEEANKMSM